MVPEGWESTTVGEALQKVARPVDVQPEQEYQQIGIRSHGKGLFDKEHVTGRELGGKRVFWIEPDCFIVNIVFAWEQAVGRTTKSDAGKIASHRFPMYRPRTQRCDVRFIEYLFRTPRGKHLLGMASPGGAGRNKTLGQKEFERVRLVLPPLAEQRKIADILSTWDQAIEVAVAQLANARKQKRALMQSLLTGKRRFPEFEAREWREVRLGDLGNTFTGLTGKTKDDFGSGLPYIPYLNIFQNSRIDTSQFDYVAIGHNERQNRVQFGDIFFTTSSETPDEVGMASVLLDEIPDLFLNSFCFGFRLHDFDTLRPRFARFFLRGQNFRRALHRLAQGATRYNLSKTHLLDLKLVLPPVEEQEGIAGVLEAAQAEETDIAAQIGKLRTEKKALMQQLLTGKRRVAV